MNQSSNGASQEVSGALKILRTRFRDGTWRDILTDWKWIWSFSRGRSGMIILYTVFGLVSSGMALASGVVSKYLIDSIVSLDLSRLTPLIILLIAASVFNVAFHSLSNRFSARLNIAMQNDVQAAVFDKLIRSDWMSLSKFATGDLLNRFTGDVHTVSGCAVSWLPGVIIHAFTVLATLIVILFYDPVMALIALASTPVLFLVSHRLIRRQRDHNRKMRQASSDMSAFESETFRNMDTLKSFGIEDTVSRKLRSWQDRYRQVALDYNLFTIRTSICLTALGTAVQFLAMGYCLWRLWRGEILFGTMVLFLQQRSTLSSAFSSLIGLIPTALSGSIAAERVRELTELPPEKRSGHTYIPKQCALRLEDVTVAYTEDRKVLSGVSLHAGPGEIIALVGPSGEGKTTLLRLLLGLVRADTGEIFLTDEQNVRHELGADTRHCFSYVPQGNTVIAGTVAENLLLANENATREEMTEALRGACAWDFVSQMPGQLDAALGEGGKGLSEGQAQRIAIARALLRRAPVMLLDEVTSALDHDTEQKVLQHLMQRGVTCIVSTHRPSVLTMCTRAYRVENGRVTCLSPEQVRALTAEN